MKVVAIHQPQYIPWVPYFDKILQSDVFVLLDTVQFEKNGVQNRNRVKAPQGPIWLTLPVRQRLDQTIRETEISDPSAPSKHLKTFEMCYKRAPHFDEIFALIKEPLSVPGIGLSELSCRLLENFLGFLGYRGQIIRSSTLSATGKGSDLVLSICKELHADRYIAGQGGKNYMVLEDFKAAGIDVVFQRYRNQEYQQCYPALGFCPDLSAIDLFFNEGRESLAVIESGRDCEAS